MQIRIGFERTPRDGVEDPRIPDADSGSSGIVLGAGVQRRGNSIPAQYRCIELTRRGRVSPTEPSGYYVHTSFPLPVRWPRSEVVLRGIIGRAPRNLF